MRNWFVSDSELSSAVTDFCWRMIQGVCERMELNFE